MKRMLVVVCSPRTWGWTGTGGCWMTSRCLFPTHVGVDRNEDHPRPEVLGVPHACGGGPLWDTTDPNMVTCSPRTWG